MATDEPPRDGLLSTLLGPGYRIPRSRPPLEADHYAAHAHGPREVKACEVPDRTTRPTRPAPLIATERAARTLANDESGARNIFRCDEEPGEQADTKEPSGFFLDNALSMAGKRTPPWER